jgi:hypothetical protein
MYEDIKQKIYGLFTAKDVRVEHNSTIDRDNFCCLNIRYQPVRGMTLITGTFSDDTIEILLLAHEFGHILHYEALSRKEAEIAYCTIFAANHLGLENISPDGKKTVIAIEKKASEYALTLLRDLIKDGALMEAARKTYGSWIKGYFRKARMVEMDASSP